MPFIHHVTKTAHHIFLQSPVADLNDENIIIPLMVEMLLPPPTFFSPRSDSDFDVSQTLHSIGEREDDPRVCIVIKRHFRDGNQLIETWTFNGSPTTGCATSRKTSEKRPPTMIMLLPAAFTFCCHMLPTYASNAGETRNVRDTNECRRCFAAKLLWARRGDYVGHLECTGMDRYEFKSVA